MSEETEDFKEKGNAFIKEKKYEEAIKEYSQGLRQNPSDFYLYSNRSFAYLKLKQFYYAIKDAEKVIALNPEFVKGYFRKAEVYRETFQYEEALLNYSHALRIEPTNDIIISNLRLTANLSNRETMLDNSLSWVGAGVGVVFGCSLVISDQIFTKTPSLNQPLLMVFMVIVFSAIGYGISKTIRYYLKIHRKNLMEPPYGNLSEDFLVFEQEADEGEQIPKKRNRYSKSQARLRFKKGKT